VYIQTVTLVYQVNF